MLTEVLAAIAVVAIGLAALASSVPPAATAANEGASLSTAAFLAGARLEEVRAAAWSKTPSVDRLGVSSGPLSAPQIAGVTTFADEDAVAGAYGAYSRQVRILDCGVPPGCGAVLSSRVRHVTVTVAYRPVTVTGVAALDKTVSLATLVAQR